MVSGNTPNWVVDSIVMYGMMEYNRVVSSNFCHVMLYAGSAMFCCRVVVVVSCYVTYYVLLYNLYIVLQLYNYLLSLHVDVTLILREPQWLTSGSRCLRPRSRNTSRRLAVSMVWWWPVRWTLQDFGMPESHGFSGLKWLLCI